jgi:hypothetical protein
MEMISRISSCGMMLMPSFLKFIKLVHTIYCISGYGDVTESDRRNIRETNYFACNILCWKLPAAIISHDIRHQ